MKIVKNTPADNTQTGQSPYSVTESGVYHADTWLCSPLHLIGTGTDNGGNYYRVAEFPDRFTGKMRRIAIAASEIGSGAILSKLQGVGITIATNRRNRENLADYLQRGGKHDRWSITHRAGWTTDGKAYILPDGDLIGRKDARTLFDGDRSQAAAYTPKGSLKGWNGQIGRYLYGNSRLCLAVGTALAAPLLRLLDIEGGGFHLFSDSSDGKTTAANVGLSVWGEPECLRVSWKGTSHGFDNIAAARNDGFLVLDEIGQANGYVVSETAYSIINGTGKVQGDKNGGNRAVLRWRVLMLSTGEKTLESYVRANRGDWQAGQAARLPSIPASAGAGLGVFEMLHDFEQPAELAEHLNQATAKHYGTLGQAWLNALINDKTAADKARKAIERFSSSLKIDSGQGRRVMMRFALVYAALSMAAAYGLLELANADCKAAITKCFTAWQEREGTGKYEDRRIIENAEEWLQFVPYSVRGVRMPSNCTELPKDFACFYQDLVHVLEVFVVPKVFETELCDGFDKAKVLEVLYQAGLAAKPKQTQKDKARWQFRKRFQGINGRYYKLTLQLEDDDDDISES